MMTNENIVLIGFMGSGKTTIGRVLAEKMNLEFYDSDDEIVKQEGMDIEWMFAARGQDYFRTIEKDMLERLCAKANIVLATGGGAVKDPENVAVMRKYGKVIYLKTTPERVYANTDGDKSRPLLQTGNKMETIKKLMSERDSIYKAACHFEIDVSELSVRHAVNTILLNLQDVWL